MAYKYYYNISAWYSSLDPLNIPCSIFPILCDGEVVGGKNNPFTTLSFGRDSGSGSTDRTCIASSGAFNCTAPVGASIYSGVYTNTNFLLLCDEQYYTQLNAWCDKDNSGGSYKVFEADTTTISGRFRFKNALTSLNFSAQLFSGKKYVDSYIGIPIDFTVNGTLFNGIRWTFSRNAPSSSGVYTLTGQSPKTINRDGLVDLDITNKVVDFGTSQPIPVDIFNWVMNNADPIYPYTYTVKTATGVDVLAELSEAPAMIDATPSAVGNVKTLTMTGVNGRTYTMTWESETPAGKQFLGLAYGANETRASIPTGRTTPVTWDGSLTIYEAYGTYRPPVTTFDINLYQSSAEVNRVDKTDFLTGVGTLSGVLREECSIIAPSITFKQTTVPVFNYVYIAAFGRYYYVTGITSVSKDIWRMSLSCDVLMTWKNDIRALTAIIARQENSFNPLLLDSELPAQANQNITVTEFPAGGFNTAAAIAYPFVLTVVGA